MAPLKSGCRIVWELKGVKGVQGVYESLASVFEGRDLCFVSAIWGYFNMDIKKLVTYRVNTKKNPEGITLTCERNAGRKSNEPVF